MRAADFEKMTEARLERTRKTLAAKATEYADGNDRLHNFKMAAAMSRKTVRQALFGMLAKHLVSVVDMVESKEAFEVGYIDEKVGDAINYLILLEAVLIENS